MSTFAVTGANGYIASQLIKSLLEEGHTVHASVRSLDTVKEKSAHLCKLDPKGEKLKFFEGDLLKEGSFASCFKGVDGVFHTASPFQLQVEDPQRDLIDPAVKGTENVIREALKSESVKRIVVTSSVAAILHGNKREGEAYSDKDWNTTASIESEPYSLSKTLAEKKAWELIEDKSINTRGVTLVTVCPSFVVGPPLSTRTDSTSVKMVVSFLKNAFKDGIPKVRVGCIDVRDVVATHIQAMTNEKANGRYIISSEESIRRAQLAEWVKEKYHFVDPKEAEGELKPPSKFDISRVEKDFGIKPRSIHDSVIEMADSIYEMGILEKPKSE